MMKCPYESPILVKAFPRRMRKVDPQLQAVRAAAQQRFLAQKASAAPQAPGEAEGSWLW